MQAQPPWWINSLAIPAFFVLLGAAVGLFFGQVRDRWHARQCRRAFLDAIAIELKGIKIDLEQAAQSAEAFLRKLTESEHAPQLIPSWGTTVFDTQLGKLPDVADHLVSQIIKTYAMVNRIERIVEFVNQNSREYVGARAGNEKADAQRRLGSALRVVREEIAKVIPEIQALLPKLPRAPEP